MKNLHNIEKSAFRKGEYIGYAKGKVWHITKTNSTYANWRAICAEADMFETVYAYRLEEMSDKLMHLDIKAI